MLGLQEKNKIVTGYHGYEEQKRHYFRERTEFEDEITRFDLKIDPSIENLELEAADLINMIMQIVEHHGGSEEEVLSYRHRKMSREVKRVNKAIEVGYYEKN